MPTETHPEAKSVVVLSSEGTFYNTTKSYWIEGEIQNENPFGVSFVKINATGYDEDGKRVNTDFCYADDTDIGAGGKSKFLLIIDDPDNKIVRYEVQVCDANKSLYKSNQKFPLVLPEGMKVSCPQCGSFDNVVTAEEKIGDKYVDSFRCNNCGYTWDEPFSTPAEGTPV